MTHSNLDISQLDSSSQTGFNISKLISRLRVQTIAVRQQRVVRNFFLRFKTQLSLSL